MLASLFRKNDKIFFDSEKQLKIFEDALESRARAAT